MVRVCRVQVAGLRDAGGFGFKGPLQLRRSVVQALLFFGTLPRLRIEVRASPHLGLSLLMRHESHDSPVFLTEAFSLHTRNPKP